jgi:hypothetical protein
MLSWRLMEATESACESVCNGEEAAAHYRLPFTRCDRLVAWCRGFCRGWRKSATPLM